MNSKLLTLAAPLAALIAAPALAHHSFAMFDADKTVTMKGVVKEFEWVNPHSWLRVTIQDQATGRATQWAFELGPPQQQIRRGWKPDSLKPGDPVTVSVHPLRDGSRGGQLLTATLPDGRTLGGVGAPAIQN